MTEAVKTSEKRPREEILSDINKLVASQGYIFALSKLLSTDMFMDIDQITKVNWRDRIHNNEFALIMGLMLKNKTISFDEIDAEKIDEMIKHTVSLLEELHWSYNHDFAQSLAKLAVSDVEKMTKEERDREFQNIFGTKDMIIETTFYGDSGFYDLQCFELAPKLYSNDMDWLKQNTKFDLSKSKIIYMVVDGMINQMHYASTHLDDAHVKKIIGDGPPMRAIDEFAFPLDLIVQAANEDDKDISAQDVKDFLDLFSCKPGDQLRDFEEPGQQNVYTYKPIVQISDGVYFFPNKMFLSLAIYKAPLYWMRQDNKYEATVNKHIGAITEDITYDYFESIFGSANTYKDVNVVKGENRVTDIDVMGIIGNTVVIAQNKSKKMTVAALSGDVAAIKADFKQAVIDPYQQGIKVRDVLLGKEAYKLLDADGKEVILPEGVEHAYILCVSNEPYPAVMDQMRTLLVDVNQLPPMQISLFDLDLITEYLKDPYEFTFYVKQRLENHEGIISSSEIIHLAYHLKHGLFMPNGTDMLLMDQSFGQFIDADYYHRKLGLPKPSTEDSLQDNWTNKIYERIIGMTKHLNNPKATDIIFFLMTIPHKFIDSITDQMTNANERALIASGTNDFSIPITNNGKPWGGITYVVGDSLPVTMRKVEVIASMNKYRAKADSWLSIAARKDGVIVAMAFDNKPWEQNREMDDTLAFYLKIQTDEKS
jgi:hypothetical protein